MKWLFFLIGAVVGLVIWRLATAARIPQAGSDAPPFSLPDQDGRMRGLGEFQGKWLVLYFFPRADTPG